MPESDPPDRIIVLGASAGGVESLSRLVAKLPASLPAAVMAVLHISAGAASVLANILDAARPLRATLRSSASPSGLDPSSSPRRAATS